MMGRGALAAVTLWWLAGCAGAVWLELATTATKCLSEEIQSNVVVIGDYSILYEEHPVRPMVTRGQFAFTAAESGNYLACFKVEVLEKGMVINLNLDWRTGIAARDWDAIAKREKLDGVTLELVKLETAVRGIHENLLYLKSKEADMRDVSEWTNATITWLSLMSLTVCITVSVLQFRHLKQYFRKKKLI